MVFLGHVTNQILNLKYWLTGEGRSTFKNTTLKICSTATWSFCSSNCLDMIWPSVGISFLVLFKGRKSLRKTWQENKKCKALLRSVVITDRVYLRNSAIQSHSHNYVDHLKTQNAYPRHCLRFRGKFVNQGSKGLGKLRLQTDKFI